MNISIIGTLWAAVKGAFAIGTTARLSIVDYLLHAAYEYYSSIEGIMANIARAYRGLVKVCDKLDYYEKYIPVPWLSYYTNIRNALGAMRDALADGKVEREEVQLVVANVKTAIEAWRK